MLHVLSTLSVVGLGGLLYPVVAPPVIAGLLVLLVLLNVLVWRRPEAAVRFAAGPRTRNLLLATLPAVILFGWIEALAQVMTRNDLLPYRVPMRTMLPGGMEDWRLAHITADRFREPDPVLLWRPAPRTPYNTHRLKGPEPAVPKPPGVFRVIAYGDSNTDGPDAGGWTEQLQDSLAARRGAGAPRPEVLNAGVVGYSSYQGLKRFKAQAERYEPDVVLVSFGWNDAAPSAGPPDRLWEPPPLAGLLRMANRYRAFLAASYAVRPREPPPAAAATVRPRVSLDEYADNLERFVALARAERARPVLLTRPHELAVEQLRQAPGWRRTVPAYNSALLDVAAAQGVAAIDVRRWAHTRQPSPFADESHFTFEGHEAFGKHLAQELVRLGVAGYNARTWP